VSIPADNLNPAIPLRLNYILWIEDLMTHSKLEMEKITGIDIGDYKSFGNMEKWILATFNVALRK